jgi:hypothetical protein
LPDSPVACGSCELKMQVDRGTMPDNFKIGIV